MSIFFDKDYQYLYKKNWNIAATIWIQYNFQTQKRAVSAATIWRNTVFWYQFKIPILVHLALCLFTKYNNFIWGCCFLAKTTFEPPLKKFHNRPDMHYILDMPTFKKSFVIVIKEVWILRLYTVLSIPALSTNYVQSGTPKVLYFALGASVLATPMASFWLLFKLLSWALHYRYIFKFIMRQIWIHAHGTTLWGPWKFCLF